jgi:putative flippase GtrA
MFSLPFVKFLLVGVLNTAFGYGLFALLIWLGLPYPYAMGIGTIMGVLFNFQTTSRLVFTGAHWRLLARFVSVYGFIYCINLGGVALLLSWGLNVYLAGALLLLPMAGVSFATLRFFVFKPS